MGWQLAAVAAELVDEYSGSGQPAAALAAPPAAAMKPLPSHAPAMRARGAAAWRTRGGRGGPEGGAAAWRQQRPLFTGTPASAGPAAVVLAAMTSTQALRAAQTLETSG
jgi:hypothetical protein